MLKKQKEYISYLDELENILEGTNFDIKECKLLKKEISETEFLIPVIGGFSAGKSAMINRFLGQDVLATGLTPETALATELRYASKNFVEAIKQDGSVDTYDILQTNIIKDKSKDYQYLKLYLNNKKLKQIEPMILVDMPGFDAPVEHHNQAIMRYLHRGAFYVLLVSAEDGDIPRSVLSEISNIVNFNKKFIFCLSKTDRISQNEIENVLNSMMETLRKKINYFHSPVVASFDDRGESLSIILKNIDLNDLIRQKFEDDIDFVYFNLENKINTIESNYMSNYEKIAMQKKAIEDGIAAIEREKASLIEKIKNQESVKYAKAILCSIEKELIDNEEYFVSLLQSRGSISEEVHELIKTVMMSEMTKYCKQFNTLAIENIQLSISDLKIDDETKGWIEKASVVIKNNLEKMQVGIKDYVKKREEYCENEEQRGDDNEAKRKQKNLVFYRTATSVLAITSSVINPFLELFIVFLPDILNLLSRHSQKNERRKIFIYEIIPSIKMKMRRQLPSVLEGYMKDIVEEVNQDFEKKFNKRKEELDKINMQLNSDDELRNRQMIEEMIQKREKLREITQRFLQNMEEK